MNLKERKKKLKSDIPAVFITLKDPRTPIFPKALAFLTIAYALSPIDLIPDFIPVLGYLDDVIILPALIALTIKLLPKDIFENAKEKSKDIKLTDKWYYALLIIFFWAAIIYFHNKKDIALYTKAICKLLLLWNCLVLNIRLWV